MRYSIQQWSGFRRGEAAVAAMLLLLGLYVIWASSEMPVGSPSLPGPGFFPTALGVMLVVVCGGILLGVGLGNEKAEPVTWARREVFVTLSGLVVVALAFKPLGAVITLAAFLAIMIRFLARIAWWRAALSGVIGSTTAWVVFVRLLDVQLPAGLLGL